MWHNLKCNHSVLALGIDGGNELVKSIVAAFSNDGGDQGVSNQK